MATKKEKHPPLIQQFIDNQKRYPDAIVATEVGGFFEIWQVEEVGHAIRASQLLDTVLTRRNKSDPNSPYMTGFPNHAAHGYFKKLVELGETVVVVEQHIHGRKADGNKNVTREVAKILSPGTIIENLKESRNNYFASIYHEENHDGVGLALLDFSTGEVEITEMPTEKIQDFLDKVKPKEILISGNPNLSFVDEQLVHKNVKENILNKVASCSKLLASLYDIKNPTSNPSYAVTSLGLEYWRQGVLALGNILNYLSATEYNAKLLKKLGKPKIFNHQKHLMIPFNGFLSLEVFNSTSQKEENNNTLLGVLDRCKTAMGRRLLKQWLTSPLSSVDEISLRHDKVYQYLSQNKFYEELSQVYDISRLSRRMIFGKLMPHEIAQFYQSLSISEEILKEENEDIAKLVKVIKKHISKNIDVPKAQTYTDSQDYNFLLGDLQKNTSEAYDQWKNAEDELLNYKEKLEEKLSTEKLRLVEKSESFFLIGPKGLANKAKDASIAVQVKANDVQITDSKWTELSLNCFGLKQKYRMQAEKEWLKFQQMIINTWGSEIIEISDKIAKIDVLSNFAKIAKERGYVRPELLESSTAIINFKNVRHPVVELSTKLQESFVPNDVFLGNDKKTLVIYGANSAGKSTILKSVALNILMAQVGSFIAAQEGSQMTTFDAILTRMTSFDSLTEGLSTFTMEMTELQLALQYSEQKAIFLFDEIGRGTSVEDGEAIAYATLMFLESEVNNCVTLFATHYHSLYSEIKNQSKIDIKNVHCYTDEKGRLVFSRKLTDGPGEGSYGLEVAKSCGLPEELLRMASRYSQKFAPLKQSRYNAKVEGTICPICEQNPVQQTHHIHEQKQGTIKEFTVEGMKKNINTQSNLLMICATCHEKITRGTITVNKRKALGTNEELIIEVKKNE